VSSDLPMRERTLRLPNQQRVLSPEPTGRSIDRLLPLKAVVTSVGCPQQRNPILNSVDDLQGMEGTQKAFRCGDEGPAPAHVARNLKRRCVFLLAGACRHLTVISAPSEVKLGCHPQPTRHD
jgi:hypothetical protein